MDPSERLSSNHRSSPASRARERGREGGRKEQGRARRESPMERVSVRHLPMCSSSCHTNRHSVPPLPSCLSLAPSSLRVGGHGSDTHASRRGRGGVGKRGRKRVGEERRAAWLEVSLRRFAGLCLLLPVPSVIRAAAAAGLCCTILCCAVLSHPRFEYTPHKAHTPAHACVLAVLFDAWLSLRLAGWLLPLSCSPLLLALSRSLLSLCRNVDRYFVRCS